MDPQRMARRSVEPGPIHQLIEPLNPFAVAPAQRDTPGFVARMLDGDVFRSNRRRQPARRHPHAPPAISTRQGQQDGYPHPLQPVSPMETLANTALTTSPTFDARSRHALDSSSAHSGHAYKNSRGSFSGPQMPPMATAREAPIHNSAVGLDERPTKRSRSEALPSPQQQHFQSRPATSHDPAGGPQYNVEGNISMGHRMRHPSQDEIDVGSFLQELANRRRNDYTPPAQPPHSRGQSQAFDGRTRHESEEAIVDTPLVQDTARAPDDGHRGLDGNVDTRVCGSRSRELSGAVSIQHAQAHTDSAVPESSHAPAGLVQTHTPPEDMPQVPLAEAPPEGQVVLVDAMEDVQPGTMGPPSRRSSKAAEKPKDANAFAKSAVSQTRKQHAAELGAPVNGPYQLESPKSMLNDEAVPGTMQVEESAVDADANCNKPVNSVEVPVAELASRPTSAPGYHGHAQTYLPRTFSRRARWASSPLRDEQTMSSVKPIPANFKVDSRTPRPKKLREATTCGACSYSSNSTTSEIQQWIQCNGCKRWFHFVCVGLRSERDIRNIDKFHCLDCRNEFGPTTYVRKSKRAHVSVDYAKLTEGVVQTGDDTTDHHFVQAIKAGEIRLRQENFPRMRPEEVSAEYFEKCRQLAEPIVIPACWNPKPRPIGRDVSPSVSERAHYDSSNDYAAMHATASVDLQSETPAVLKETAIEETAAPSEAALLPEEHALAPEDESSEPPYAERNAVDMSAVLDGPPLRMKQAPDLGQDRLGMVIPQELTVRQVADLYGPYERLPVIDVKTQQVADQPWTVGKWADYYEDDSPEKTVRNVISLEVSQSPLGRLLRRPDVVRDLDLVDSVWPKDEGVGPKVGFYVLMSVKDSFTDFHIDFGGSSVYYHILRGKKTFFFIPPKPKYLKIYEDWNKSAAQNYIWLGNETKECYRIDLSAGDTMIIPAGWIHSVWTPENSLVVGGNFLTRLHFPMQFRIVDIEKATNVALKYKFPFFQKVMWFTIVKYLEQDPLPAAVQRMFLEGKQFPRQRPVHELYNKFGHNSDPGPENYNARYYPRAEVDGWPDLVSFIFRTVMIQLGRVEGVTVEKQNAVIRSIPKNHGNPLENARKFAMWVAWKRGNEDIPQWAHPDGVLPDRPGENDKSKKLSAAALKKLEKAKAIEAYVPTVSEPQSMDGSRAASPSAWANSHYASPKNSVLGPKRSACDACRKRRVACKHKIEVRDASMINGQRQFEFVGSNKSSLHGRALAADAPITVYTEEQPLLPPPPPPPPAIAAAANAAGPPLQVAATPTVDLTAPSRHVPSANGMAAVHGVHTPLPRETRNKACAQCRRSKRRCLHDENGQLDPAKLAEATKRAPQAKKRPSISGGEPSTKKIKRESTVPADFHAQPPAPVAVMVGPSSRGPSNAVPPPPPPISPVATADAFEPITPPHYDNAAAFEPAAAPAPGWDIDPALMADDAGLEPTAPDAPAPQSMPAVFDPSSPLSSPLANGIIVHDDAHGLDADLESSALAAVNAIHSLNGFVEPDDPPVVVDGDDDSAERMDVDDEVAVKREPLLDAAGLVGDALVDGAARDDENFARLLASQEFGLRRRS